MINYSSDGATWGYNMTNMIAKQLKLSNDPEFMAKFNTIANKYKEIK